MVYFFAALIKHKIRMRYEECTVSVSYFLVCFAKTFVKYKKCIAPNGRISLLFKKMKGNIANDNFNSYTYLPIFHQDGTNAKNIVSNKIIPQIYA